MSLGLWWQIVGLMFVATVCIVIIISAAKGSGK